MDTHQVISDLGKTYSSKKRLKILESLSKKQLENIIKILKHHYYNTDSALVTDEQYDDIEQYALSKNVKISIGAAPSKRMVQLPYHMGSLSKVETQEDTVKWMTDFGKSKFIIEDKLNGVSGLYVCGAKRNESRLYTRGKNDCGQNITPLLEYLQLPFVKNLAVRGELILTKNDWEDIHNNWYPDLKNSLGAIVSAVNSLDGKTDRSKILTRLKYVVYEIVDYEGKIPKPHEQLKILNKNKFEVVHNQKYQGEEFIDLLLERKNNSEYEVDGIVIAADIKYDRCDDGNPSYSIAFKNNIEFAETQVTKLDWIITKGGILKPRVHFNPVHLCNADLKKAFVHHAKMVIDKGIGVGARIMVVKAKEIIPQVSSVIEKTIPDMPECQWEWDKTQTNIFTREESSEKTIRQIQHFCVKLGIKNFGRGLITKCVNSGFDSLIKIINMSIDDFLTVPTFKDVVANKVYINLHTAMEKATLAQIMAGSNCFGNGLGVRKLQPIISRFPNILTEKITKDDLCTIQGCKDKTINKIIKGLRRFKRFWKRTHKHFNLVDEIKLETNNNSQYTNKTYVFSEFRDKSLEDKIIFGGGRVTSAVSSKTSALIVKSLNSNTTKVQKAKKLGVPVIEYKTFLEI